MCLSFRYEGIVPLASLIITSALGSVFRSPIAGLLHSELSCCGQSYRAWTAAAKDI